MAPKYPAIPEPTIDPASLRDAVMSLKQAFEILSGQRGAGQDAAVTPGEFNSGLDAKVSKSGDVMTGSLMISPSTAYATLHLDKNANSTANNILGTRGAVNRWLMRPGNDFAESSGNAGSDFDLYRYADDGSYLGQAAYCNRASGAWTFSTSLDVIGYLRSFVPNFGMNLTLGETTGGWNKYIRTVNGGDLQFINHANTVVIASLTDTGVLDVSNGYLISGHILATNSGASGFNILYNGSGNAAIYLGGSTDPSNYYRNSKHYFQDLSGASTFGIFGSNLGVLGLSLGTSSTGWHDSPLCVETAVSGQWVTSLKNVDRGILYLFSGATAPFYSNYYTQGTTSNTVGSISHTTTTTAYTTSSDERKKEDFKPFDAGNILDRIDVHNFRWKTSRERAHGVIAQQVTKVYPEAVHHDPKLDYWAVDYSKFVPLLLQEVKALRERIKVLEAGK